MLLILMGILGQMQSASGQGLPEACYRLAVARPGLQPIPGVSWSAIERLEGEVVALLASQNSSAEIDQRLTEAREQDSLVFDAALARVVVSVRRSGTAIAAKAGDQYWRVHGVARAILAASDLEGDYSRRHLALAAIRQVMAADEQALVMSYACDAAWQLTAFRADPRYAEAWLHTPEYYWPADAKEVILEAQRLLKASAYSSESESLVSGHVPPCIGFQRE